MSQQSSIQWTDATWNPIRGCVKVSAGCKNCYAETFAERFRGVKGHPYEQGFDLRLVPEKLAEPLTWKKPRRVFVNSMSDLFQDGVPDEFIARAFAVMAVAGAFCPDDEPRPFAQKWTGKTFVGGYGPHTFQVLTKRPARMQKLVSSERFRHAVAQFAYDYSYNRRDAGYMAHQIDSREEWGRCYEPGRMWPLSNVWLGVSVENQHFANERIPLLLQTPAAIRFISAEPLLGSVDLSQIRVGGTGEEGDPYLTADALNRPVIFGPRLDWVIVGGEFGRRARPFDIAWARSIVRQCADTKVACFVKQLGAVPQETFDRRPEDPKILPDGWVAIRQNNTDGAAKWFRNLKLTSRKGGDITEWPTDLQVREFPRGRQETRT